MSLLRFTLVSDGSAERALLPVLEWLLSRSGVQSKVRGEWADPQRLPRKTGTLADKIILSLDLFPCELLFVHRDAEKDEPESRVEEINAAVDEARKVLTEVPPLVCVVPVRMLEAWFLFDESAIRKAAGNTTGKKPLDLPPLARVEGLPNPKERLLGLLRDASGLRGRRLRKFRAGKKFHLIPENTRDFSPLFDLPGFEKLYADIRTAVNQLSCKKH